jgi:xylan 1,4-beta-xylosidase
VTIRNPILPGFNPDPSILRVGDDYYIATSTFEWLPGLAIHHSQDLQNWTVIGHALTVDQLPDLRGFPSSTGVWAPSLTFDETSGLFYLVYGIVKNQVGDVFDVDNFLVTAASIAGPWSAPIYLTSVGFDGSLFHDDDGRKWVVALEWDPRDGYEHPGAIVLEEYIAGQGVVGTPRRIHRGTTNRGCLEAPVLFRRGGYYYLMTAEGGTGYGHGVALARSREITGPYEPDPGSPFITSWPFSYFARNNPDFLRPEYLNPGAEIQKAGHGGLVSTQSGEWYVAHLGARPLKDSNRSVLGRETFLQKVEWNEEGWLRQVTGDSLARLTTDSPSGYPAALEDSPTYREVHLTQEGKLHTELYGVRRQPSADWVDLDSRPGSVRLRAGDSLFSLFDVSLLATPQRAFTTVATAVVDVEPAHFSQFAGLTIYYNNRNWALLRVYHSETLGRRALGIVTAIDGVKKELQLARRPAPQGPIRLKAHIDHGWAQFLAGADGEAPTPLGPPIDVTYLSDEFTVGFTGTSIGITAVDCAHKDGHADFSLFEVRGNDA